MSILMSFVVLVIYKYISSPTAITDTKDKIKANILAIRIYKDFWKVIVLSFIKSLFYTFKYFILNFGPVLVIIPILFPAFAQMDVRYGMRPFQVGEDFVIEAAFSQDPNELAVQLLENENFKPKMNPVYINAYEDLEEKTNPIRQVNWKVEALKDGVTSVKIQVGPEVFEKSLVIGNFRGALSKKKFLHSSFQHFFYPAETLLKDNRELESVYIKYPGRNVSILGFQIHWIVLNLLLVVIIVLAFRKRFGVEF